MLDLGYDVNLIKEVYTAPLRSALMIDDRFPTYQELIAGIGQAAVGDVAYMEAAALMNECRSRNLLCDVRNNVDALPPEQIAHLGQSDLIVLDYHLDQAAAEDPEKAIQVLLRLARSPHANLVVVYTREDVSRACRTVAARFKGASDLGIQPLLEEDQQGLIDEWDPAPSEEVLDSYLRGERGGFLNPAKNQFIAELRNAGIPNQHVAWFVSDAVERFLRLNYLPANPQPGASVSIEMSSTNGSSKWVSFANVFVVFVSKLAGPETIFPALEQALLDWHPLPMQLMLAHVRNRFEAGGFSYEMQILDDPARLTGWFYHALAGDDHIDARLKQLWTRLLESLQAQLTKDVAAFGTRVLDHTIKKLENLSEDERKLRSLALAKELAGARAAAADSSVILHALNAFLCSEPYSGSHVRTGTICQIVEISGNAPRPEEWVLCSSPACEMVPRPPRGQGTWTHDLDPIMAVTILRLNPQAFSTPLKNAEEGKHIFLRVAGEDPRSFEVLDAQTGHPRSEGIFVTNRGLTEQNGYLDGYVVRKQEIAPGQIDVVTVRIRLRAVGQLRPSYADRFLHQLGQHSSRIGVDFVNPQ